MPASRSPSSTRRSPTPARRFASAPAPRRSALAAARALSGEVQSSFPQKREAGASDEELPLDSRVRGGDEPGFGSGEKYPSRAPPLPVAELDGALIAIGGFEPQPFVAVAVSGGPD